MTSVQFLGHMISAQGISVDPSKVEAVLKWERPKLVTDSGGALLGQGEAMAPQSFNFFFIL